MRDLILTYLLKYSGPVLPAKIAKEINEEKKKINQCLFHVLKEEGLAVQVSQQKGWQLTQAGVVAAKALQTPNIRPLLDEIDNALNDEIIECQQWRNIEHYPVNYINPFPQNPYNDKYIYTAELYVHGNVVPHFHEGLRVTIRDGRYSFEAEVIEYDFDEGFLYFSTNSPINWHVSDSAEVIISTYFILRGLQDRIANFRQEELDPAKPIYKFVTNTTQNLISVEHDAIPSAISANLDPSQKKAFDAALDKDITLIWGPPGTGKSYTLATIIRGLYELQEERTIVCCVSNVAVDQLVNKVIDTIERDELHVAPGNIYRAGRSSDERILSTEFLFPDDAKTKDYRRTIERHKQMIETIQRRGDTARVIELKAEIRDLKTKLRDHTDYLKAKSRIVFSTIANFTLHNTESYDNLIVDEASMLAFPQLMALASKIGKRIILVGDFQQLSPIALTDNKWLNNSIFKYCGIDIHHINHPALHLLLNQRRSNQQIVALYNSTFYRDKLVPTVTPNTAIIDNSPEAGKIIAYIPIEHSVVHFTRGGTRQNDTSADCIIQILDQLRDSSLPKATSIGIITPYVGQSNKLFAMIKERHYPEDFAKQVSVGTVHTFQGSECDIIIFDIVDSNKPQRQRNAKIGKIYEGADGEQLLNVALSRARQKLYVVGDIHWFVENAGKEISQRTIEIIKKIERPVVTAAPPQEKKSQPSSRKGKKWSANDISTLVICFNQGQSYSEIAHRLRRPESAITERLQILKLIKWDKEKGKFIKLA